MNSRTCLEDVDPTASTSATTDYPSSPPSVLLNSAVLPLSIPSTIVLIPRDTDSFLIDSLRKRRHSGDIGNRQGYSYYKQIRIEPKLFKPCVPPSTQVYWKLQIFHEDGRLYRETYLVSFSQPVVLRAEVEYSKESIQNGIQPDEAQLKQHRGKIFYLVVQIIAGPLRLIFILKPGLVPESRAPAVRPCQLAEFRWYQQVNGLAEEIDTGEYPGPAPTAKERGLSGNIKRSREKSGCRINKKRKRDNDPSYSSDEAPSQSD